MDIKEYVRKYIYFTTYEEAFFQCLGENDILFIDSSHVSKFIVDVNSIFFKILPKLKRGVYIHFHNIFSFKYPKKWIYEGRAYNEIDIGMNIGLAMLLYAIK